VELKELDHLVVTGRVPDPGYGPALAEGGLSVLLFNPELYVAVGGLVVAALTTAWLPVGALTAMALGLLWARSVRRRRIHTRELRIEVWRDRLEVDGQQVQVLKVDRKGVQVDQTWVPLTPPLPKADHEALRCRSRSTCATAERSAS
jgi:hypothetical protein